VETEVQYLFNAADAVVCPYERTLNSGVALLAATFGVPVIGPAKGGFTDNLPAAFRRLYDEGHPDGLTTALADADLIHAPNRSPDVLPDELMPAHVSRQFLTNVLHKLGLR
jgi:beta-1,4-mannosyltransferase